MSARQKTTTGAGAGAVLAELAELATATATAWAAACAAQRSGALGSVCRALDTAHAATVAAFVARYDAADRATQRAWQVRESAERVAALAATLTGDGADAPAAAGAVRDLFGIAGERSVHAGETFAGELDGYALTLTVEHDGDSDPRNADAGCYTAQDIADWEADRWAYVALTVRAALDGVTLAEEHGPCGLHSTDPGAWHAELADETAAAAVEAARQKLAALAPVVAAAVEAELRAIGTATLAARTGAQRLALRARLRAVRAGVDATGGHNLAVIWRWTAEALAEADARAGTLPKGGRAADGRCRDCGHATEDGSGFLCNGCDAREERAAEAAGR